MAAESAAPLRRVGSRLAFAIYLAAVFLGADYLLYLHYAAKITAAAPPNDSLDRMARKAGIESSLFNSLGALEPAVGSGFPRFARARKNGVIRVGAFGDSFTHGDETASGLDFPSQLSAFLKRNGYLNVEVINFGSRWWSFGQSFRLWDLLGRRFGLDFLLLGPEGFHSDRSLTFAHGGFRSPYYLHGRYVLDRDSVRFENVVARNDFLERGWEYHRFLPHWNYLRYDRKAPAFLACLLPAGREIANPFYYSVLPKEEEALEIYARLLTRMAKENGNAILLHVSSVIAMTGKRIPGGLISQAIELPRSFPYWRLHHCGAAGNALLAKVYFDVLTGKNPASFDWLRFHVDEFPRNGAPLDDAFARTTRADAVAGGMTLGTFVYARTDDEPEEIVDFKNAGIASMLALRSPLSEPLDAIFLGMKLPLLVESTIALDAKDARGPHHATLGRLRRMNPRLPIALLTIDGLDVVSQSSDTRRPDALLLRKDWLARVGVDLNTLRSGSITLNGRQIYRLRRWDTQRAVLDPVDTRHVQLKPLESSFFDIQKLHSTGVLQLSLVGAGGSVSIARWSKERFSFSYERSGVRVIQPETVRQRISSTSRK